MKNKCKLCHKKAIRYGLCPEHNKLRIYKEQKQRANEFLNNLSKGKQIIEFEKCWEEMK